MSELAPSILSADFANLGEAVRDLQRQGCDMVHVDVMDGRFVPNITIGPSVVKAIRPYADTFFDVHLMIAEPLRYIEAFSDAGADGITVHVEALPGDSLREAVDLIHRLGKKAAVAVSPDTPISAVDTIVDDVDMVLIMTVYPGFGGQSFIEPMVDKIKTLRKQHPALDIQVDGGINDETLKIATEAGANILVMGTGYYKKADRKAVVDQVHALCAKGLKK